MIVLTKLNGQEFVLNADLIRHIETCPDTLITLIGGDNIMVRESMKVVVGKVIDYQREKNVIPCAKTTSVIQEPVLR